MPMEYFVLVMVAVVSFIAGRTTVKKFEPQKPEALQEMRVEAKKALGNRTEERKAKIVQLIKDTVENQFQLEECSGMITPRGISRVDVENLLDVSSTTARRYLNVLEEENIILQIGESGKDVRYVPK